MHTTSINKIIVICSGGMDSYTLLQHTLLNYPKAQLKILSFNYGQRHVRELEFAKMAADDLKLEHQIYEMPGIGKFLNGSSLTSDIDVPEGHYAAPNMRLTVVPGRNTIMLSIAMGIAEAWSRQTDERVGVVYGAHTGDHTIYPDCRPDYYEALKEVFWHATENRVELFAPYINISKIDILAIGKKLNLDYGKTWSCYNGRDLPCGKCGACTERAEAFELNDMVDPWVAIAQMLEEAKAKVAAVSNEEPGIVEMPDIPATRPRKLTHPKKNVTMKGRPA